MTSVGEIHAAGLLGSENLVRKSKSASRLVKEMYHILSGDSMLTEGCIWG
jgi:hypothetical protein